MAKKKAKIENAAKKLSEDELKLVNSIESAIDLIDDVLETKERLEANGSGVEWLLYTRSLSEIIIMRLQRGFKLQ